MAVQTVYVSTNKGKMSQDMALWRKAVIIERADNGMTFCAECWSLGHHRIHHGRPICQVCEKRFNDQQLAERAVKEAQRQVKSAVETKSTRGRKYADNPRAQALHAEVEALYLRALASKKQRGADAPETVALRDAQRRAAVELKKEVAKTR